MNKIIKQSELEHSFKHAARLALSGTREERSGRSGGSPADIAMRLRNELRIATLNWATVEAFNATFEGFRDRLIAEDAWQAPMFGVRAMARDVIMTLMHVTDGPGHDYDRETICRFVGLFNGGTSHEIAEATGASEANVAEGLSYLRARVPALWGKNHPLPGNRELADIRTRFEPIRNRLLAHAQVYSSLDLRRDVPKTREFLRLVSRLSDAACMICNVPRDDLQDRWDGAFAEAERFWKIVAVGVSQPSSE